MTVVSAIVVASTIAAVRGKQPLAVAMIGVAQ